MFFVGFFPISEMLRGSEFAMCRVPMAVSQSRSRVWEPMCL